MTHPVILLSKSGSFRTFCILEVFSNVYDGRHFFLIKDDFFEDVYFD